MDPLVPLTGNSEELGSGRKVKMGSSYREMRGHDEGKLTQLGEDRECCLKSLIVHLIKANRSLGLAPCLFHRDRAVITEESG